MTHKEIRDTNVHLNLLDVSIFYADAHIISGKKKKAGYYWWTLLPSGIPIGKTHGPYKTHDIAKKASTRFIHAQSKRVLKANPYAKFGM